MSYPTVYKLDPQFKNAAYMIGPNHQTLVQHDHNVVAGVKFHIYHMGLAYVHPTPLYYGLRFGKDLSKYVVDFTYDCKNDDNTKTSASVTLCRVPEMWQSEWVKREHREEEHPVYGAGTSVSLRYDETICFHLVKTYYYPKIDRTYEIDLGFFKCTNNQDELSSTSEQLTLTLVGMSCMLQPEYGGTPSRATEAAKIDVIYKKLVKDETTGKMKVIISNIKQEDDVVVDTPYIPYGTQLSNDFVYESAMGSWAFEHSVVDESVLLPLRGAIADPTGVKTYFIYEDKSFNYDASRQDVMNYIVDTCYYNGHYWVNEDMYLITRGQQDYRNPCIARYADYGDLFIEEQRSYDDSNVFNCVVVTSNVTINDTEINYYGKYEDNDNITTGNKRCLYIEDNNLRSHKECETRAKFECWIRRWGHETFSVKLADTYLSFLILPSEQVGRTIEYKTAAGFSVSCTLEGISMSSGYITLSLRPFKPIRYPGLEDGVPNLTAKQTLGSPQIVAHEVWHDDLYNYYVRLFAVGDDIQFGLLKGYEKSEFVTESCAIDNQNRRYIDMPVKTNGEHQFYVQLFSPYFENSNLSSTIQYPIQDAYPYVVNITEIEDHSEDYTDPYPHPLVDPKSLLTDEDDNKLTDESDNILYTTSYKPAEI